jgi:uncharacterized protein (TIGR02453 family)
MKPGDRIFTPESFRFFRELARNNRKPWMDTNRERYRAAIVTPFRTLLSRLTPFVLRLSPAFDVSGRTGRSFSRINRDIRFAADKAPYRAQMYLKFSDLRLPENTAGQPAAAGELYVGLSAEAVTAGFRIYSSNRQGCLARLAIPRAFEHPAWLDRQARRLARRYEGYWYANEKGAWVKHEGWPKAPAEWKRVKGWVVRRKMKPAAALSPGFAREIDQIFRDLFPLYRFTSSLEWRE